MYTVELAKYCGDKTITEFVGEVSKVCPKKQFNKRRRKDYESPSVVVNINYIFPGGTPANILSNTLPANPTTTNFVFDWNQGKICPDTVVFDESRFSEFGNETINSNHNSFTEVPVNRNETTHNFSDFSLSFNNAVSPNETLINNNRVNISTPVKYKPKPAKALKRKSASPTQHKRKKKFSHKNAFVKFIVQYRLQHIHEVLEIFKNDLVQHIVREFKALELYTDLLEDLKMNCKKGETSLPKRLKDSEDDPLPKTKKAARMEENFRHMLLPDSKEEANRKDECEYSIRWFKHKIHVFFYSVCFKLFREGRGSFQKCQQNSRI